MKSKTEITIFTSDIFGEIRTCQVNNQIMFAGKDVATALGYRNPSNALQVHVDPEDKTTYPIQVSGSNYKTNALFVNESGYAALSGRKGCRCHWQQCPADAEELAPPGARRPYGRRQIP